MSDSTTMFLIIFMIAILLLAVLVAVLVAREQGHEHWEDMLEEATKRLELEERRFRGINNKNLEQ